MTDLPSELLQELMDWLPTFKERALLRRLCRGTRRLRWRRAAPFSVDEDFSSINLLDEGVSAICAGMNVPRNLTLKELCLGGNKITDEGARTLAHILRTGKSNLRRLSLRDNVITDEGALVLAAALASSGSLLAELDLWGNKISEQGKLAIASAAPAKCEVFLELPVQRTKATALSVDVKTRFILFDWISQVQASITTAVETAPDPQELLLRTFSHVDAYLACRPVRRAELQLVGLACTLVATRLDSFEEDPAECEELVNWLAFMTDGGCTAEEVREAAREVRRLVGSSLHQPTVYTFLRRYLRQTGWSEASFSLANYLSELAASDGLFSQFRPQAVAAAAAILSRQYVSQGVEVRSLPSWRARLLRSAGVDLQEELAPCAAALSRLHAQQNRRKSAFISKKYEWPRLHAVAKLTPHPPSDPSFFVSYLAADAVTARA